MCKKNVHRVLYNLDIREKAFSFLDDELTTIVLNFESKFGKYIDERTMGS